MDYNEKISLLNKYGMSCEVKTEKCQIGITGSLIAPVRLAGKMFGIDSFSRGMTNRPYVIELCYGESLVYAVKEKEEWKETSEEAWHEAMLGLTEDGIDESLLESRITVPCEQLKEERVWVLPISDRDAKTQWEKLTEKIDRWCVALTATHLLSSMEKEFLRNIRKYYAAADCQLYLGDMEHIYEEKDRRHINECIDAFSEQFSEAFKISEDPEKVKEELFKEAANLNEVMTRREKRILKLQMERLGRVLKEKAAALKKEAEEKQEIADEGKYLGEKFARLEKELGRQIRIYYLREFLQEAKKELDAYDMEQQKKLEQGIEEEEDLTALSENITPFLLSEWEKYLEGEFVRWLVQEANAMSEQLNQEFDVRLKKLIQGVENAEAAKALYDSIYGASPDGHEAYYKFVGMWKYTLAGSSVYDQMNVDGKEGGFLKRALPIAFITVGVLAGMTGTLLPGIALAAIGIKSKISQEEEREAFRKELKKEAALREKQILKYVKQGLEKEFENLEEAINRQIAKYFEKFDENFQKYCSSVLGEKDRILTEAQEIEAFLQNIN
ncbi:MAG: hypothetical protein Q4E89_11675 [Eubacteriales bacterium]|nr:hypothetical protein [Eubacteriales bacterium]